jgi:lipoprotein-anchoring transpeptidase ErfK/SrfK
VHACSALVALLLMVSVGCASERADVEAAPSTGVPSPPSTQQTVTPFPAYAVTARRPLVEVHAAPDGPVTHQLEHPQPSGAPLVFLLDRRQGSWLRVHLPVRPNGSTGWVRAAEVTVTGVRHRLDVRRSAHRLELYTDGALTRTYAIGIGTRDTPTPGGTYYLKELLRPPDPDGAYGPYAYGLSGFSTELTSFNGGQGVIGLHGTDDPASIGRDVSHGCIRLANDDITELVGLLPLGTPVRILS